MYGHSDGHPWDNQNKDFSYLDEYADKQRKDEVKYILSNFGKMVELDDIPIDTTFLGVEHNCKIHELAKFVIDDEIVLAEETQLNKVYERTSECIYSFFILITDNEQGLKKSHWYRSVEVDRKAKIKKVKIEYVDIYKE